VPADRADIVLDQLALSVLLSMPTAGQWRVSSQDNPPALSQGRASCKGGRMELSGTEPSVLLRTARHRDDGPGSFTGRVAAHAKRGQRADATLAALHISTASEKQNHTGGDGAGQGSSRGGCTRSPAQLQGTWL